MLSIKLLNVPLKHREKMLLLTKKFGEYKRICQSVMTPNLFSSGQLRFMHLDMIYLFKIRVLLIPQETQAQIVSLKMLLILKS